MMKFIKATKKPVEVKVCRLTEDVWNYVCTSGGEVKINNYSLQTDCDVKRYFLINTLEDVNETTLHRAELNDWLIIGVEGEIYACKPNIFEKTYSLDDIEYDSNYLNHAI